MYAIRVGNRADWDSVSNVRLLLVDQQILRSISPSNAKMAVKRYGERTTFHARLTACDPRGAFVLQDGSVASGRRHKLISSHGALGPITLQNVLDAERLVLHHEEFEEELAEEEAVAALVGADPSEDPLDTERGS
jgi:hypothetical protein